MLSVAILHPKTITVAFKFLNYVDLSGQPMSSKFMPNDASDMITALNEIYWPQACITFDLKKAAPLPIKQQLGPINDAVINNILKPNVDPDANTTVFMVPPQNGATAGTHIPGLAVVEDDGADQITDGTDPHTLTLAHELAHALGRVNEVDDRDGVLLSSGKESVKIIKEVVERINYWDDLPK